MRRPEVSITNQSEVYNFYKQYRPNLSTAWLLHHALGTVFHPKVAYADGAEEAITSLLADKRPIVLAANHTKAVDPCIIAALPSQQKSLRSLIGNTFIPSKSPIFKPVLRRIIDGLGAIPVFREEDGLELLEIARSQSDSDQAKTFLSGGEVASVTESVLSLNSTLIAAAGSRLVQISVARMNAGQNMAIFPEGTRNKTDDPTRVQELNRGIGLMVCKVKDAPQPPIIPMGIFYGDQSGSYGRAPYVYIGQPSLEPFLRPRAVMAWLGEELQNCATAVAKNSG